VAFDADRIFVTNPAQNRVDIARLDADGSTAPAGSIDLAALQAYGGVNSVAVKNGVVAVAYQNVAADQPGFVALFDLSGNLQKLVQVGILPDQLTFTPDGLRILVANEGEAVSASNNPAGSISIISLAGGPANAAVSNTIGFSSLNGNELVLAQRGLALFSGQSAAGDVEPEYISVSPDGTRAYVTLQEVNGIAVIDLTDPTADRPLSIQPLGAVDRTLAGNAFDPSDQNGISLVNANVQSLLQPDAIAAFTIGGLTYFVTANEGDARVGGLSDEVRLSNANYRLDPTAYPNAAELKANAALGRLNVLTTVGDTDGDGDFDQIFTFGGRSISIFRQEADGSLTKVRETGGEFEAIIARDFPSLFNVENGANPDNRSDNKGPEPEGVSVGQVGDRIYAFVTLERVGGVVVYDVTDPANARFVSYKPATAQDFAPETVQFVAGAANATGQPLLLSANEGSGTTTLYRVVQQNDAANLIQGAGAADTFNARGGDDTIQGAGGNDRIDGGAGTDTAVFGGARADYLIDRGEGGTITVRDMREGAGDGIDTLSAVELFQFADGTRSLSQLLVDETVPVSDDKQGYRAGRAGNDELFAIGADAEGTQLRGNRGDDLLVGGAYDDVLVGNFGDDVLVGGAGADQFRFFGNEIDGALDVDRIFDLNFAEGDRLVFGEFASGTFARSRDVTAFAGGSAAIVDSFSDLRKLDAASDRIIVTRLNPSSDTLVVEVANGQGQVQRILISDAWQNYQTETGAPLL
jgi:Ca2+-binding RTX toxin-like protein